MEPEESLRFTAITTLSHFQHSQLKQWLWEGFKGVFWQLLYPVAGQISEQNREENEGRETNEVNRLSKIHRSLFNSCCSWEGRTSIQMLFLESRWYKECVFSVSVCTGYFIYTPPCEYISFQHFFLYGTILHTFANSNKNLTKWSPTKLRSTQTMNCHNIYLLSRASKCYRLLNTDIIS